MNRYVKISFFLLTLCLGCTACQKPEWRIDGHLEGDVDGNYVFLQYADTSRTLIDSALISGKTFSLKGKSEGIRLANLSVGKAYTQPKGRIKLPVFLETGVIRLKANYDSIQSSRRIFDHYRLSGTPSNRIFAEYMENSNRFDREDRQIFAEYGNYLGNKPQDYSRAYFEKGIELTRKMDSMNRERITYTHCFLKNHRNSEAAFYLLTQVLSSLTVSQIDSMRAVFPNPVKQSPIGRVVEQEAELFRNTAEGAMYIDFPLMTPEGEKKNLSDFIGKGNYILLECWASWCGPCKKDIPHVKEVLKKYGPYGFGVLGISMDTQAEAWKKAIREHHITWPQLSNLKGFAGPLTRTYRIRGIPTCILIDPEGRIVMRNARGSWLDRWLIDRFGDLFDK